MSFRKNRKAQRDEPSNEQENDVKVAYAKGDSPEGKDQQQDQQEPQPVPGQQSGQESGQPAEQTSEEEDEEPVPEGTTAEILRWVGGDKDKAQRALDKEKQDDRPRSGLTRELNEILGKE